MDELILYLLCKLGFHPWAKWGDPKKSPHTGDGLGQERTCQNCGKIEWHWLHKVGKCEQHKWIPVSTHNLVKGKGEIPYGTQYISRCAHCGIMKDEKF